MLFLYRSIFLQNILFIQFLFSSSNKICFEKKKEILQVQFRWRKIRGRVILDKKKYIASFITRFFWRKEISLSNGKIKKVYSSVYNNRWSNDDARWTLPYNLRVNKVPDEISRAFIRKHDFICFFVPWESKKIEISIKKYWNKIFAYAAMDLKILTFFFFFFFFIRVKENVFLYRWKFYLRLPNFTIGGWKGSPIDELDSPFFYLSSSLYLFNDIIISSRYPNY